jgi:hypothetical protein
LPPQCGHVRWRLSVITHFNAGVWSENLQNNRRPCDERTGSTVRAATICGKRREKFNALPGEQLHAAVGALRQDAKAVVLDLVNPVWPGRWLSGGAGKAGLDELGQGTGTRTRLHAP